MLQNIIALATIPLGVLGLQRKAEIVGPYAADLRLSGLESATAQVNSLSKSGLISKKRALAIKKDIAILHKANDMGWVSAAEIGALTRIVKELSAQGISSVANEFIFQVESLREKARSVSGSIATHASKLGNQASKTAQDLKDRITGQHS